MRRAESRLETNQKKSGRQTPRRWGWGIPLKKRAVTRTKSFRQKSVKELFLCLENLPMAHHFKHERALPLGNS
jgi:hypothetical protein